MLLSVITLAESGKLGDGCIRYSPDLLQIFARYFDIVRAGNDQRTPVNPYFYLRSDGFWLYSAKNPSTVIIGLKIRESGREY
jgi:hypothetical protein